MSATLESPATTNPATGPQHAEQRLLFQPMRVGRFELPHRIATRAKASWRPS